MYKLFVFLTFSILANTFSFGKTEAVGLNQAGEWLMNSAAYNTPIEIIQDLWDGAQDIPGNIANTWNSGSRGQGQIVGSALITAGTIAAPYAKAGGGAAKAPIVAKNTPDFIVSQGGTAYPVPQGASGPTPVASGKGFQFTGGSGGHGLSPKVTDLRIMDPITSGKYQYPSGYGSYGNAAGQAVNPLSGQTIPKSDPWWHIPIR